MHIENESREIDTKVKFYIINQVNVTSVRDNIDNITKRDVSICDGLYMYYQVIINFVT